MILVGGATGQCWRGTKRSGVRVTWQSTNPATKTAAKTNRRVGMGNTWVRPLGSRGSPTWSPLWRRSASPYASTGDRDGQNTSGDGHFFSDSPPDMEA
jgi:hypothetical protein